MQAYDNLAQWHLSRNIAQNLRDNPSTYKARRVSNDSEEVVYVRNFSSALNTTYKAIIKSGVKQLNEMAKENPEAHARFVEYAPKMGYPVWITRAEIISAHGNCITERTVTNHLAKLEQHCAFKRQYFRDTYNEQRIYDDAKPSVRTTKRFETRMRVWLPYDAIVTSSLVSIAPGAAGAAPALVATRPQPENQKLTDNQLVTKEKLQTLQPFKLKDKDIKLIIKDESTILTDLCVFSGASTELETKFGGITAKPTENTAQSTDNEVVVTNVLHFAENCENVNNSENIVNNNEVINNECVELENDTKNAPQTAPNGCDLMLPAVMQLVASRVTAHLTVPRLDRSAIDRYANMLLNQMEMLFNGGNELKVQQRINAHYILVEILKGADGKTDFTLVRMRAEKVARAFIKMYDHQQRCGQKAYHILAILSQNKTYFVTDPVTKLKTMMTYLDKALMWVEADDRAAFASGKKSNITNEAVQLRGEVERAVRAAMQIYTDLNGTDKAAKYGKLYENLKHSAKNVQFLTQTEAQAIIKNFLKSINFEAQLGY
jgi:hypothetical protein